MIDYYEMSPDWRKQSFIRKFWILDNSSETLDTKYALPNTCFTLAIISGNGLIIDFQDRTSHMTAGSYLVGLLTKKVGVTVLPNSRAFMVQLNPWAATLLSKCSYLELVNQFSPLIEINRALASAFAKIYNSDYKITRQGIQNALENYLYPTASSLFIEGCFHHFNSSPFIHPFKLQTLSSATGYSLRYIEKKFRQHIGVAPKSAFNINRIRKVVDELAIRDNNELSLTSISYKYGYSDQAHFTKSYSSIMNSPPSRFILSHYILPFGV
ncbi:helix-turn-helix domain-containing protein [Pedobacter aquatilis]|uniref:helix-turn-helix domain-containing protein n=1 Tax=Pedobacter aquatilis TaxID=351343 RepID=UPI00292E9EF7|nr:helix-turn-helix domain-containing protein [Pedobacter aquatilis]